MRASFLALLRSITPFERKVVFATALAIMVITAIPPVYGWAVAEESGKTWIGRQFLSPGDSTVYLSYIDQAKSGALLAEDLFTTEPIPTTFNILWYSVGRFAALCSLTPSQAYHAARLLLIPLLAAASYFAICFFLVDRRHRLAAFLLYMFGSGMGAFVAPFLPNIPPMDGTYLWPIDFWDGEANAFLSMVYSPHFVASLALWLSSILILAVAYEKRSALGAAAAGLIACVLFQFHPYNAPVMYAVAGTWCVLAGAKRGWSRAPWLQLVIFGCVSAPAVAYAYFITHVNAYAIAHAMTNHTMTPPPFFVLVGLGAISALWIPGARSASRSGAIPAERLAMLVAWVIVQSLLLYAPFRFQRRFLECLQFPLTVLAVPALFDLYARLKSVRRVGKEALTVMGILVVAATFLISTALAATRNVEQYSDAQDRIFFIERAEERAAHWFRSETPTDTVVLTTPDTGGVFVPMAGRRVYVGHWSETIGIERKSREVIWFYHHADDAARAAFIRERGITHVYVGPVERMLAIRPFGPAFERVFHDESIDVYVLKPGL